MDDFMALIGAAPTTEDQQRKIAELLRGRRSMGELGAITGDRVLQPFGANMIEQADAYARQLQQTRQSDIDDARTKAYNEGQLGHMGRSLDEAIRHNREMERLRAREIEAGIEEAQIRADGKITGRKMTDSTRNRISDTTTVYAGINELESSFKPDYTQKAGPGPQSLLPNAMARYGLGTKGMEEASNWWAAWGEIRTLPERNRLFGATLTANEKSEWDKIDINPAMSPELILQGINRIKQIIRRAAQRHAKTMLADQFDPEQIMLAYGEDLLFDPPEGAEGAPLDEDEARIQQLEEQIRAQLEAQQDVEQP